MGTFGQRLKELRNDRGISQNELSKHIGVSKSSVNMYERDEREPGFETLEAIADFFNVNMDYLLGREQEIIINVQVPERLFSVSARPTLIKFIATLNSPDSPNLLEDLAQARAEMDTTFSVEDFEHLSEVLRSINAAYEQALNLVVQSGDSTAAKGPQVSPAPQEGTDTTPLPDAPETPSGDE